MSAPAPAQAGYGAAGLHVLGADVVHHDPELGQGEVGVVAVPASGGAHVGQRQHGTRGSDRMPETEALDGFHGIVGPGVDLPLQLVVVGVLHPAGAVDTAVVREPDGAHHQAVDEQVPPALGYHHLGAASADVYLDGALLRALGTEDTEADEPRLLRTRDDLQVHEIGDRMYEVLPVGGLPDGARGKSHDPVRPEVPRYLGEPGYDQRRLGYALLVELAHAVEGPPQAD